jgi:hypothetical protein
MNTLANILHSKSIATKGITLWILTDLTLLSRNQKGMALLLPRMDTLAEKRKNPGRHLPGHVSTFGSTTWLERIPLDTHSLARGWHWPGFESHCPAD